MTDSASASASATDSATTDATTTDATTGTTAADSGSGTAATTDGGSTTTGGACVDSDGDNEDEASASDLGEQACDEGAAMFSGTIVDMADQDWFALHGAYVDDMTCGNTDPVISVAVDDAALTVCVFFACDQGVNEIDCGDADPVDPGNGELGCCQLGGVDLTMNCGMTGDESANISIQVFSDAAVDCVDYTVTYDYDV
ncbi:MAG: hypothetical protein U0168_05070 [Nannocystaceae bacterium]